MKGARRSMQIIERERRERQSEGERKKNERSNKNDVNYCYVSCDLCFTYKLCMI